MLFSYIIFAAGFFNKHQQEYWYKKNKLAKIEKLLINHLSRINFPSLYFWHFSWAASCNKELGQRQKLQATLLEQALKSNLHISIPQLTHNQRRICRQLCASQSSSSSPHSIQLSHSLCQE